MEHNFRNEYRTGGHTPEATGGIFAAAVLVLLSVSCMFFTAGFMILRADPLDTDEVLASVYTPEYITLPEKNPHMDGEVTVCETVGITCQSISDFCEKYYQLPSGIYVLQVTSTSPADRQGVLPGDVLVRVNGESIHLPSVLQTVLDKAKPNSLISLDFFRKGKIYTIYLTAGA